MISELSLNAIMAPRKSKAGCRQLQVSYWYRERISGMGEVAQFGLDQAVTGRLYSIQVDLAPARSRPRHCR